ncbi:MAG: hypothetical protein WA751_06185 [Candidatus Dormiibacterota bacterium]
MRVIGLFAAAAAAAAALSTSGGVALASAPNGITPPPGVSCQSKTDNPHASKTLRYEYVIDKSYLESGCTVEVSSLTLHGILLLGSLSSGQQIAEASATVYNTVGVNDAVYAEVLCSTFGNGKYSAKTTGSFTYEGETYPVDPTSQDDISVTGC